MGYIPYGSSGRVQRGIPLNDETFATMKHEEVLFWEAFLKQATVEIDQAKDAALSIPYKPSATLTAMYRQAIAEFGGEQYCQVQQLQGFFDFQLAN